MTDPLRCLIVDDEPLGRSNLRHALAAHAGWQVAAECASVAAALPWLQPSPDQAPVDLVFLDIQMPGESGLALARRLAAWDEPPIVVFVTAFGSYALEAFDVHALDYLLKPFDDPRFARALERAEALLRRQQPGAYAHALRDGLDEMAATAAGQTPPLQALGVRSTGRIESVRVADVQWIGAAGNYVELHLDGRSVLHRMPLTQLERRLDAREFLRVHRSTLVRREQCAALGVVGDGSYALTLRCGATVAVSERFVAAVRAVLVDEHGARSSHPGGR